MTDEAVVRLSSQVVEIVKLRMTFVEDQGELLDIEQWLKTVTTLEYQGDYWLMVLKDNQN